MANRIRVLLKGPGPAVQCRPSPVSAGKQHVLNARRCRSTRLYEYAVYESESRVDMRKFKYLRPLSKQV